MMTAYYNEFEPFAAQWLRNLIKANLIAPGDVDERSIEDVRPDDLRGYVQCHFFAGIGVWSYALRLAGWEDSRPVWTGSCPCQPFSAAGKGNGFADERHLWPDFHWLIQECRPECVIGEQVASKDAEPWIDLVQLDLETLGYAFGAVPFPSAGVGAPHIRDRLYWVANANQERSQGRQRVPERAAQCAVGKGGLVVRLANPNSDGRTTAVNGSPRKAPPIQRVDRQTKPGSGEPRGASESVCGLADADSNRCNEGSATSEIAGYGSSIGAESGNDQLGSPGPTNGFWRDADWLGCRDGKWRPVEPGFKQMVDGSSSSLGHLCPDTIKKIEGEINAWSIRYKANIGKALHDVQCSLSKEALGVGTTGRLASVLEAPVLLAFLRQFQKQRRLISQGVSCASEEKEKATLRVLRYDGTPTGASRRRELDEQYGRESTDPVHLLSSILAQNALKAWGEDALKNACDTSPIFEGSPNRVGRLRGYGNAINAQAAKVFIEAVLT